MAGRNVTIGNVNIAMSANASQLILQVQKAESDFKKALKGMMKATKTFNKQMNKALSATGSGMKSLSLGAAGATAAMGTFAAVMYESQREAQRMADVAGVSMATFQEMSHVTNSLGLQTEYLSDAMKDLNVRIQDASMGGGTMRAFFIAAGESAAEWAKLNPTEQLSKFQEKLGEMNPAQAKFWADEINDSMYRLHVTLQRSGQSLADFQEEAKALGAGTSSSYMDNVNEMYVAFHKIKIILAELSKTTLNLLAKSFTTVFDTATEQFKQIAEEGESMSEAIFRVSKQIATAILTSVKEIYIGIESFINRVLIQLGKFDKSFSIGLFSDEQLKNIAEVEMRIKRLESDLDTKSGLFGMKLFTDEDRKETSDQLKAAYEELKVLQAGIEPDNAFTSAIDGLLEGLEKITYIAPKAKAVVEGDDDASPFDPGKMETSLALVNSLLAASASVEDSKLRQIALDKEKLEILLKQLQAVEQQQGTSDVVTKQMEDTQKALQKLDEDRQKREDYLRDEKARKDKEAADKELRMAERALNQRMAFDEQYLNYRFDSHQKQYDLEEQKVKELRDNDIISKKEAEDAKEQIAVQRMTAEMHMHTAMLGDALTGLNVFFGEREGLARAGFALSQGVALNEVIMAQAAAVSQAWADPTLTWWQKGIAAATAAGAVGQQISVIQQAGQFHNGGEIPYDGTYYMEGGEIVIPKDKVGDYIDAVDSNYQGGGTVINSNIHMGANLVDERVMAEALSKQQSTLAALVRKEEKKRPTRNRKR